MKATAAATATHRAPATAEGSAHAPGNATHAAAEGPGSPAEGSAYLAACLTAYRAADSLDNLTDMVRDYIRLADLADLTDREIAEAMPTFDGAEPPEGCDDQTRTRTLGEGENPVRATVLSWDANRILELHRQDFRLGVEARLLMMRNRNGGDPSVLL